MQRETSGDANTWLSCSTRRDFLIGVCKIAAAASAAGMFVESCGSPTSNDASGSRTIDLDDPMFASLATVGAAIKVGWPSGGPVIVRHVSQGTYEMYSTRCPHAGCEVGLPVGGVIVCPCHGSRFDADGGLLSGPATRGLQHGTATLDGRQLKLSF